MHRVEADKCPPALRNICHHAFQIAEIPHPPVVLRAQGVELHGGAPQFLPALKFCRLITALGRDNNPARPLFFALTQQQLMVAVGQILRQANLLAAVHLAVKLASFFTGKTPLKAPFAANLQALLALFQQNFAGRQWRILTLQRLTHRRQQLLTRLPADRFRLAEGVNIFG
ncbi:Uncharacterised protein [Klebsiella pneumoniae]|nr:Uncharacterised protein [Klebsiella pneumoniae]